MQEKLKLLLKNIIIKILWSFLLTNILTIELSIYLLTFWGHFFLIFEGTSTDSLKKISIYL